MELDPADASKIKEGGWRQGSILCNGLVAHMREQKFLDGSTTDRLYIVVSHDCDLNHHSFEAEPIVEILPAIPINGSLDGNKLYGKNPRCYHLSANETGLEHPIELSIHSIIRVPRPVLCDFAPDQTRTLKPQALRDIRLWLARRYSRQAFPDAFNDRTKIATQQLRKIFKKKENRELLSAIYLLVEDDELGDDNAYNVTVWATMTAENYEDITRRDQAQDVLNQVEAVLGDCSGIEIESAELRSEEQITLADLRFLKRWDFDDLSLRDDESDLPPTE